MYVCVCNAITETEVRASVSAGANTFEALQLETGLGTCCGTCAEVASTYLPGACPGSAACAGACAEAVATASAAPAAAADIAHPMLKDCAPVRWVSRAPHAYRKAA